MQLLFCILSKNTNYITPETGKKKKDIQWMRKCVLPAYFTRIVTNTHSFTKVWRKKSVDLHVGCTPYLST